MPESSLPSGPIRLPAARLRGADGRDLDLAAFRGRPLVVFAYPRADTPGCTREALDFTRLAAEFEAAGARVVGLSADAPEALARFAAKHALSPVLATGERDALDSFGVWGEKSMYGRRFEGVERTTFLFDGEGNLARAWRKVKVEGHAEEVLAAVRALKAG